MRIPPVLDPNSEPDARVWSCVCCGTIYGADHDPFQRCASCDEACYTLTTVAAAIARRARIEAQRRGAA